MDDDNTKDDDTGKSDDDSKTPPKGAKGRTDDDSDSGKKFSQDDLDRHLGKTRGEASKAAKNQITDTLGMSVEDAKKLIDAHNEAQKADMTEAERIKAEAETAKAEAEAETAKAREATLKAELTSALLSGEKPLKADRIQAALQLAVPAALGADDDQVNAGVEAVRELSPEWFTDDESGNGTRTPGPPGRKTGERNKPAQGPKADGQKMFDRFGKPGKSPMPTN